MKQFVFRDFHKAGLLPSRNSFSTSGLFKMGGMDPLVERGQLRASDRMLIHQNANSSLITTDISTIITCSDGNIYAFGGAVVYQYATSGSTWSVVRTVAPGAGGTSILCAMEFNGYIYYATESRLGRWQVGTAWSGATDNWQTFANTDAYAHPMIVKFGYLFIGDGRSVHAVDSAGVYSADALKIEAEQKVVCFADMERHIAIGTRCGGISDPQGRAKVYIWDTYSIAVTSESLMDEPIVTAMGNIGETVVIFAGFRGMIYVLSGYRPTFMTRLPHDWATQSLVNERYYVPQGTVGFRENTLYFGVRSFQVGLGTFPLGVYGLGRASAEDPLVLYMPYLPVQNLGQNVSACLFSGALVTLIATSGAGSTDKSIWSISTNTRSFEYDFFLETPRVTLERSRQQQFHVEIPYGVLATTWNVTLTVHYTTSSDNSLSLSVPLVNDTQRRILEGDILVPDVCEWYLDIQATGTQSATGFAIDGIYVTLI